MDEQRETIQQNAEHQGDIHAAVMAERARCGDIAFRSIQIKTGSIGCALQVRDDILTGRRSTMRPEEIAALHAKAKAVDDSLQQS